MSDEQKPKQRLEIGHVLFVDIVGYSKLLTDEQSEALHELNQIVRNTETAREAEAAGQLTILPTGDGMALVFTGSVEEPADCALEISHALRAQPSLPVRMGIHSGPVHHVKDANERENVAGVGINIAQRVMDCGDAGHILVSKRVADDLAQQRRWQPYLHELGDVEVKHGVVVSLVNFYAETIGNPTPPGRIGKVRRTGRSTAMASTLVRPDRPLALATLILAGLLIALAIVSVIFAPAIMRSLRKNQVSSVPQIPAIPSPPPSFGDVIKNEVAKKITDELQNAFSQKKKAEEEKKAALEGSTAGLAAPEKSIAVLPFENLSEDKSNTYFAEGIQDEILTRLSKIADLKVISRTSTQKYKSAPDNLREIGKQLGVANVLEGSVQRAADQVRVNVQLINAMTDAHLWADTYDRKLTDIFTVETEIAKTIADMLQAKLSGSEQMMMAKRPTENSEAYELYLKGRFFWNKRTAADLRRSIEFFNEAIAKDPNYAPAYAGEAQAWSLLSAYNAASPADSYPQAEVFAKKALAIDETSAEALVGLGSFKARYQFDVAGALKDYERAIQLNPNDATAHHWLGGDCFAATGQHAREVAELKRALELDPLSLIINSNLGVAYTRAGNLEEAVAQFRKTIEIDGSFYPARREYGVALELQGKIPEAIAQYEKAAALTDDPIPLGALGRIYGIAGRKDEAQKIFERLRQLRAQRYTAAYSLALVALGLGDKTEALHWLEEGYRERDGDSIGVIRVDPLLISLHGDPRFEALAEKILPAREFAKAPTRSK